LARLVLNAVTKQFGAVTAVAGVSLEVADREFLVLVGPSGCGKTTLLRMIAGLEEPTAGDILIGDRRVNDVASRDRDVAVVFQNYALYPHMTVFDNMAFPLKMRHVDRPSIVRQVQEAADLLSIGHLLKRRPRELSGGERQRVALGRAIVRQPQVFLMDEPLSNLDAKLRVQTRTELVKLQRRLGATVVYVTHDQSEAMTMADRIAVLDHGVLQQVASPDTIYAHPANTFVGGFFGTPGMNFCAGRIVAGEGGRVFESALGRWLLPAALAAAVESGQEVVAGLRPEHLALATAADVTGRFEATVDLVETLGSEKLLHLSAGGETLVARVGPDTAVRNGASITCTADLSRLQLFDATTGDALC